jgi:hypothetical protein
LHRGDAQRAARILLPSGRAFGLHTAPINYLDSGTVSARFQRRDAGVEELRQWLLCIVAASPSLKLFCNDRELQGPGVMHSSPDLREG